MRHHSSNLAIAPFTKLHIEQRSITIALDHLKFGAVRARSLPTALVWQEDTTLQMLDVIITQTTTHTDLIPLVNPVTRVRQTIGQLTIIGQQQKPR